MDFLPTVSWCKHNKMERTLEVSGDGSTTLRVLKWDEPYHSRHGAIQESQHVFIEEGLKLCRGRIISILEMGFGTGLNALLTYIHAKQQRLEINYLGLEAFPLREEEWSQMNYVQQLGDPTLQSVWQSLHKAEANTWTKLSPEFDFQRAHSDVHAFEMDAVFHLIYFDAFGPRVQPELWTEIIFKKMYNALLPGGILVTYCAKGAVRRAMQQVGFVVERLAGPPGKREMLRATK